MRITASPIVSAPGPGRLLGSIDTIPEPHAFAVRLHLPLGNTVERHALHLAESAYCGHGHANHHRDHNMRTAFVHVAADAAVSVLAILGLMAGKFFGRDFMDPVMGVIGAVVMGNWSFGLSGTPEPSCWT